MPRDNQMYYLSEVTNLRAQDKSLKEIGTEKFSFFDHQIVTDSTKAKTLLSGTQSEFTNIWSSDQFKGPINYQALQDLINLSIQRNEESQIRAIGE